MADKKNICGDCIDFTDTGRCRCPQSGRNAVGFFSPGCSLWQKQNQIIEDNMEKFTIKNEGGDDTTFATETNICKVCNRTLPLESFKKNRFGYTNVCKECSKDSFRRTVRKNPNPKTKAEVVEKAFQAVNKDAVKDLTDAQLAEELRARGYEVTATKTITQTITL